MKCPICGTENDYNWPLQVDGQIKTGGCQDCWEKQSDEEWWKTVVRIDKMMNHCDSTKSLTGVHYPNRRGARMERIMKSKMNVIALMYRYDMRKNIGPYTFSFVEGKYLFAYHNHSTGRYLRIFIVAPDGDKMEVYYATEWYSSRYYFNGFGKGYTQGPWVKEIEDLFAKFRTELAIKLKDIRVNKRLNKIAKEQADAERYSKFAVLCEHLEPPRGE